MYVKLILLSLLFGFMGAAVYGKFFSPPAFPPVAVIKYRDNNGKVINSARMAVVDDRARILSEKGFIIFNDSALYSYPSELAIPTDVTGTEKK